jgi:primosomal replication protein N
MSGWGTNGNANRIKDTYIKGFLDVSGGPVIVEKTSTLQIMAHDRDVPILEFKPEYFTVNTTSTIDISYSALAALSVLGVSFEQSTVDVMNRIKYITTGSSGAPPNEILYTQIGNDDEKSQLQVYGRIKGHYGLEVDGDVSFNNRLYVNGDSSFNGNLVIGSDLSLNGNLYVVRRALFGADVSMNGNVDIGLGSSSVAINKDISAGYALDVSGFAMFRNRLSVVSDVSLGSRLTVVGDASFNSNLAVGSDLSLNGNLYVVRRALFGADVSMNGNVDIGLGSSLVAINKDISAGYALDVSGFAMFRNRLSVVSDVSLGSRLTVVGDASFNGNLAVGSDLSLNGNLYVVRRALFGGDVSMNGNVDMGSGSSLIAINKDISAGYALDVSGFAMFRNQLSVISDVSLGNRLTVVGDASFNGNLAIGSDLSLNGNLYVVRRALFGGDVSMNGNVDMGSGSSLIAINKDISAGYALDVSGFAMFRNRLSVVSDVSLGSRLTVVGDASFNGNFAIGSDLSLNGNLYVVRRALFGGDVSMSGNVDMGSGSSLVAINKDISAGYALDVSGFAMFRNRLSVVSDVSLGSRLTVVGDASFNGNLAVGSDLSLNGNLYVVRRALFGGDVSMNGNVDIGLGSSLVAINKDISAGYALDVSGFAMFRNRLSVMLDVSLGSRLTVVGDASFNGNFAVGSDLSLNGNLYVVRRALFGGDVSMNGNVDMGSGSSLVAINKDISAGYALDVSGFAMFRNRLSVMSDVSLGSRLTVVGDASFNGNFAVGSDLSLNGNLYVVRRALFGGDVSMNGNLAVGSDLSLNGNLYVVRRALFGADVSMNGNLAVGSDLSLNGNLYVVRRALFGGDVSMNGNLVVVQRSIFGGDVSMNGNLAVGSDLSLNGNLYIVKRALFGADVSMNGNLTVVQRSIFGGDVSMNGNLAVGSDLSLNGNLYVVKRALFGADVSMNGNLTVVKRTLFGADVSMNGNLAVGSDLSLNGNLYVVRRALFGADVSINGNVDMGSGSSLIAINKDISAGYALDVSGFAMFRNQLSVASDVSLGSKLSVIGDSSFNGNLNVGGTFTVNGLPVSGGGGSLTGNVQVGTNSGFVTIDKPQFFSDPSLTIYYDFDSASYTGTTIANKGNGGSGFTATLQGTTTGMIDTSVYKFPTASLKQNSLASNNGLKINATIPVSNTFSISLWVKKSATTTIDRLFEFSNVASGSSENDTIALNLDNATGKLVPIITNGSSTAVTLSNISIFNYNINDNNWNHILWILVSGKSYIYINGSICQIDNVGTITNLTNRAYGFIATTNNNTGYIVENANIDDFRYYKDKALSYAEIYQLYNNNFYTLDICGGFLANGSSVIYEPSGSKASANRGTLTLLHGDASGSSSIMFKSVNDPLEYAYIQYEENSAGSTGVHYGLMTIGIENDAGGGSYTSQADRIALVPSGGSGFVGINTNTPQTSLDVSGTVSIKRNLSLADLSSNPMIGGLILSSNSGRLLLGNYYTGGVATRSAIQSSDFYDNIDHPMALVLNPLGGSVGVGMAIPSFALDVSGILNTSADANINSLTVGRGSGNVITNVAIGYQALNSNTTGVQNVAIGNQSLYNSIPSGTTGYNTAVGHNSLRYLTTGSNNVAIGVNAGGTNATTSSSNTFLGANTGMSSTSWTNSTAVGSNAQITADHTVQLGNGCTAQATSFNATSDYREKENVLELDETFTVDVLRPVVYDFKPLGKKHIGFIAHEVQEFYPFLVTGEKDGPHSQSMNYNGFIGILTKEIKELKRKVAEQEARALEQSAKALEQDQRIQALEKMVFDLINK